MTASHTAVLVTSLLGSLGAAGAAVTVTYCFLIFLRDVNDLQNRLFEDFRGYHAESQKKFQDQLDRLSDRHEQLQRGFQTQIDRISATQELLVRDSLASLKMIERSNQETLDALADMEKAVAALRSIEETIGSLSQRISKKGCFTA